MPEAAGRPPAAYKNRKPRPDSDRGFQVSSLTFASIQAKLNLVVVRVVGTANDESIRVNNRSTLGVISTRVRLGFSCRLSSSRSSSTVAAAAVTDNSTTVAATAVADNSTVVATSVAAIVPASAASTEAVNQADAATAASCSTVVAATASGSSSSAVATTTSTDGSAAVAATASTNGSAVVTSAVAASAAESTATETATQSAEEVASASSTTAAVAASVASVSGNAAVAAAAGSNASVATGVAAAEASAESTEAGQQTASATVVTTGVATGVTAVSAPTTAIAQPRQAQADIEVQVEATSARSCGRAVAAGRRSNAPVASTATIEHVVQQATGLSIATKCEAESQRRKNHFRFHRDKSPLCRVHLVSCSRRINAVDKSAACSTALRIFASGRNPHNDALDHPPGGTSRATKYVPSMIKPRLPKPSTGSSTIKLRLR